MWPVVLCRVCDWIIELAKRDCLRFYLLENVPGLLKRYRGQASMYDLIMQYLEANMPGGWARNIMYNRKGNRSMLVLRLV